MKKKVRSAYLLESLEARLLFSADLAPLPVDGGTSGAEFESNLEISLQPDSVGVQEADEKTQERQEVIFVDSGVDDYQQLIDDIESQLEKGRQFDIVNLDSDSDGIDQISAYLRQHERIDAVHVVSHGSQDAVKLGNVWLTPDKLDAYADAIEGWQQVLSSDADLLFYGCNLAADDGGQELIDSLTLLTGADVAASDDVTGNAKLGGDWDLEYSKGAIETAVAFSTEAQQNWNGVLSTFTVNTTADTVDAILGDGIAEDTFGNTSLRAAIMEANALGGSHTIVLGADTYTLTITGAGENAAATGDLDITADITITGINAASTVIDAGGFGVTPDRVFHIRSGAALDISGVTIQGGDQNNSGGIFVDNSTTLYLSDALLQNNTSDRGGAIHVHGTANLERVLLYNNTADKGGAIHFHGADGGSLINVTISGNDATSEGGGLWTDSVISVTNCTITLNDAPNGGGIVNSGGTVNISNTIVAENLASSDPDVEGTFNSQGNNLIGDEGGATGFTDGVNGDQVGTAGSPVDPMLSSLQNKGGFTSTHALLAGSPAIDPAGLSGAPPYDQRGFVRDVTPDIGAFEYNGTNTAPTLTVTGAVTVKKGTVYTLNLSASDPDSHTITSWTINWGDGTIETIPGNPSSVTHTYSQAGFTYDITVSATDVTGTYIAGDLISTSLRNDRIYWFDPNNPLINTWVDVPGVGNEPVDVQFGPDGEIYVTGFVSNKIFRYNADGSFDTTFVDGNGLSGPARMAFGPDGNLYVTNLFSNEVLRFSGVNGTSNGVAMGAFISTGLDQPDGIAFGPDGNLYVANRGTGNVLRFDGVTGALDPSFTANGPFGYMDIQFGPDGRLWVTNLSSDDIRRYSATDGAYIDTFASAPVGATDYAGIAFGPDGYVYMDAFDDDKIIRYPIGDGSAPEPFVLSGAGGLDQPVNIVFTPAHQVKVVANYAPVIDDATFDVDENSTNGTSVGTVPVTDPDAGDTHVYTITAGNTGGAFAIDNSGNITVANSAALNFETTPVFTLTVQVQDQGGTGLTDTATITINLNNLNEAPVINNSTFSVDENAANGTLVGTVAATDSGPADNYTMLYWVDVQTDELRRINLDGTGNEQLAIQADGTAATGMRSVTVDDVNGKVYWVNNNSDEIWRANLDGSSPERILSGIVWPMGIAVDAAGEKIYWFDNNSSELWWADLDGANAAALITAGINHPKALTIDAIGGKLYWTDWGLNTIMRANLDGSNLETVVAGLDDPYGIALDTPAGKVYWAEPTLGEIQRADMIVGATAQTVITGLSEPRAVTVDTINGKLYYVDAGVDRIERANLDGSAIEIVTATGDWPTGLAIGPPVQNLTYAITGGNTNGAFTIDSVTGAITVANSSELDFETTPVFNLTVTVTDAGGLADSATITINLNDINETPSAVALDNATVAENDDGAIIGNLTTTDPDSGDTHSYTVDDARFEVVAGQLKLKAGQTLDLETEPNVNLNITSSDAGGLSIVQGFTVTVTNVNETPSAVALDNATVAENDDGAIIGNLTTTDPDSGDTHSYTVDDARFEVVAGQLKLKAGQTLDLETEPNVNLNITSTDAGGLSIVQGFTVTVTNVNETPSAVALDNATVAENDDGAIIGNLTTTDPDSGDTHSYTVDDARFEVVAGQLKLKAGQTLDLETEPNVNLNITSTDAGGLSIVQGFTITVTNVNETPSAVALDNTTVAENDDGAIIGNLTTTDPDSGDTHSYTVDDARFEVVAGQLKLKAGQTLDLETEPNVNLNITSSDAGGLSIVQGFTITVTNVNEAPSAVALDNTTVAENDDGAIIGNLTTTDPDSGDTHSYTVDDARFEVVAGQLKLKAGQTLDLETEPSVNLNITSTDAGGLSIVQGFTITVTNVNETPSAVALDNATVAENDDGAIIGNLTTTDPDSGDTHSYTVDDARFEVVAGQLKLKAGQTLDFETEPNVNLNITSTDAGGLSIVQGFTLTVSNVNETPSAVALDNTTVAENDDGAIIGNLTTTDSDSGDTHSYTVDDARFEVVAGQLKLIAGQTLDFETEPNVNLNITSTDAGGLSIVQGFTLTVNNVNETPSAVALDNTTVAENDDGAIIGNLTTTDPDSGDTHTYTVDDARFEVVAGQLKLIAGQTLDFETEPNVNLNITSTDAGGLSIVQGFTLTVNNVNETPSAVALDNTTVAENDDGAIIGNLTTTDPDSGDTHSYTVDDARFEVVAGQLKLIAGQTLDFETEPNVNLNITSTDAGGLSIVQGFTVTVTNVNETPSAVALDNATVAENDDGAIIGNLTTTDPDSGDTHSYTVDDARFEVVAGQLKLKAGQTLDLETEPNVNLNITSTDAGGLSIVQGFTLTVSNVNETPSAVALDNTTVAENDDGAIIGNLTTTDPDSGDTHSYTVDDARFEVVAGQLKLIAGQTLDLETEPNVNLNITSTDAGGLSIVQGFTLTVSNVNETPSAVALDNTTVAENDDGAIIGNLTTTDPDSGDTHTYTVDDARFEVVAGQLKLIAGQTLDFETEPSVNLNITSTDSGGLSTVQGFTLTVNNVNDVGSVTIDNMSPAQGDTLTANVIDPDGISGAITYQWFSDGAVIGGATGKTYTTTQTDVGAIMTVMAIYTDDQGTAEGLTSAPTAPVTNINDTPIALNDNLNATEDQSVTFTSVTDLLSNDSDIDGDTLTISSFSQPANGSLADNGDGTVTYTSAGNFNGVDSFTYTISDNKGGTATGAAIIVVTPVGDTPQVTNVSTDAGVQSGPINIDRNANDGAEVTYFKISGITNGILYLADGVSRIDSGDFITVGQGQAGLRFTPAANSTADGSFNVESSEDGVSVASQSGIATSIISILTTAPQPSEPVPSLPPSDPEEVISEETEQEESEDLEDVAEETDVQADTNDLVSVETPQSSKAPGIKKASMVPGLAVLKRADLNSNDDRTPGRSTLFSPQTIKKLIESENLGELKTALRKLDITTLPPDVYELVRGSLDAVQEEMGKEILIGKTVVGSAIATSVGLSAGYVVWMLKGGSLLASVLSSLPAWQLADPLAILVGKIEEEEEEDDTLETIIKDGSRRNKDKESKASESDKHKKESTKR